MTKANPSSPAREGGGSVTDADRHTNLGADWFAMLAHPCAHWAGKPITFLACVARAAAARSA